MSMSNISVRRRTALRRILAGAAMTAAGPCLVPSRVLGAGAPSRLLQIGVIGCGRIGNNMEIPMALQNPDRVRIVAVCDLDAWRLAAARQRIGAAYAALQRPSEVTAYSDFRMLLADPAVDAVMIATPDHQHALIAVEAALAGKDIWLQKPCSMTLAEGRAVCEAVRARGRVLQIGSQQRSQFFFRRACELVRSGYIGKLQTVRIGLPVDVAGGVATPMPVPSQLDYDRWLGSVTDALPYTVDRVHPQGKDGKPDVKSRPGWLRCEPFCLGMITGWGSHHFDIAHWGMNAERTGPLTIEARAEFPKPKSGLWNVHLGFKATLTYADGVRVIAWNRYANGVRFEGDKGWIFVSRDTQKTAEDDPIMPSAILPALDAGDRRLLKIPTEELPVRLHESKDHFLDWIDAIVSRRDPVAPAEVGHRSNSACILTHMAMRLKRPLAWDPAREAFVNDPDADRLRARPERDAYSVARAMKSAGMHAALACGGWPS